ncbi:hypothetical protein BDV18DRAFT_164360 [Aspergillus unguis]
MDPSSISAHASSSISKGGLYATIWVEFGVCTLVMALRAYSQFFVLRKFTADDIVMLAAYIVQGIGSALCTASAYYGLGASVHALAYADMKNLLKYAMVAMPFGVVASLLGRISFILFLLSSVTTVHNYRRKLLWVLIGLQVITNVVPCILQYTQCDPVDALWDPMRLIDYCQGATVVMKFGYFQGAFNALTDLLLIIIGLAVILRLKMHRSNKLVLCSILSLSLLAMVAAILKTVQLRLLNTYEFSREMGIWVIWFLTEGTIVIITASVPRLRAIVVINRHERTKSRYQYPTSEPLPSPSIGKGFGTYSINVQTEVDVQTMDMDVFLAGQMEEAKTTKRYELEVLPYERPGTGGGSGPRSGSADSGAESATELVAKPKPVLRMGSLSRKFV